MKRGDEVFAAKAGAGFMQLLEHGSNQVSSFVHVTPLVVSRCDILKKLSSVVTEFLRSAVCSPRDAGAPALGPTPVRESQSRVRLRERHTRNTFITSSPRWLMTLTAMRPEAGLRKGREVSLWRLAQASSSISARSVVLSAL